MPSFFRSVRFLYYVIGVVIIAAGFLVIRHLGSSNTPAAPAAVSGISHVRIETVAGLSSETAPLEVVGNVTSLHRATILAQTAGEIVSLPHAVGDHVSAGEVIGQFENRSQRAAVVQAEGSFEAAQAALAKATSTTAANSGITSAQASTAAQNAASSLATYLHVLYAALDDAVHTRADTLFTYPESSTPKLLPFTVPNGQLVINIQNERSKLKDILADASTAADETSNTDVSVRAAAMLTDARTVLTFLNDLISVLNQAVSSNTVSSGTISAGLTSVTAARTEVVTAVSSVTTAKSSYDSAVASAQTAANSANTGTQNDVAAAEASLKSAQGALDAAEANLEKTIIRSPISGTIVSLPITQGDYVSTYSQVAIVSNPGALYVDTQVTPDDAKTLAVGVPAVVSGSTKGIVTFIAPALDPSTGKIEVKVGFPGDQDGLTDGESVTVALSRRAHTVLSDGKGQISIPIVALKIAPQGPLVFTVSTSSTLVAHPVTLGSILGSQVVVLSGLTPDMHIVTDARGLSVGESVIVDMASSTAP